jgi:hypothetical protein
MVSTQNVKNTLSINCYFAEDPDTLLWTAPCQQFENASSALLNIRELTQDKVNVYFVVAEPERKRFHFYAIEKRTAKVTRFYVTENPIIHNHVSDSFLIITPNYLLIELSRQKIIILTKQFKVHREIVWNANELAQTMVIYGPDNYNLFHVPHDRVYLDSRPVGSAARLELHCYSAETGEKLFSYQIKAFMNLNVNLTYMTDTHWIFAGSDGESRIAAAVDLASGHGMKLALSEAYYIAETPQRDDLSIVHGFCAVDYHRGSFSFIKYESQSERGAHATWTVPIQELNNARYQPNSQIQVIHGSVIAALMYGSFGCFLFVFDMKQGSLLWKKTIIEKSNELEFSHFDIHVRMKVLERNKESSILIQGAIREYGFFVYEYDLNGKELLENITLWTEFDKVRENLEPPKKISTFEKLKNSLMSTSRK